MLLNPVIALVLSFDFRRENNLFARNAVGAYAPDIFNR